MKRHVKLFEEFLREEDPLGDLDLGSLGGEEKKPTKKEEDPFKKEKEAARKRKKRAEKNHEDYVKRKKEKIEDILKEYPEVDQKLGDKIISAVNSQDRVKIHNAFNELMALQIKFQEEGDAATVNHIAKLKDQIDDLDNSYTNDKMM